VKEFEKDVEKKEVAEFEKEEKETGKEKEEKRVGELRSISVLVGL
jgi:hypothetical protein